jgi:HAD superfamily hydrolase (TIGR01549 family)
VIRGLLLDLDGTLLAEEYGDASIRAVCVELAARTGVPTEQLIEANARAWSDVWAEIGDRWMIGLVTGDEIAHEGWSRTLLSCGVSDSAAITFAIEAQRAEDAAGYRLYDDVLGMLESLSRLPFAVVTNGGSDTQRGKLDVLGLTERAAGIAISGEIGAVKPQPAIFDFALSALGLDAASVVMVGDSLSSDVAGANAAEITSVWLNRNGVVSEFGAPVADHTISSLSELPPLLSTLR